MCWFGERPLQAGDRLRVKHTTRVTPASCDRGHRPPRRERAAPRPESTELVDNEIGVVRLHTATPLAVDPYRQNRITGSFVLVDEATNITVAAGMVGPPELADLPEPAPTG